MTPAELRKLAASLDEKAKAFLDAGDMAKAEEAVLMATKLYAAAAAREALTGGEGSRKVNSEHLAMTDAHRASMSESRKPRDVFLKHIRKEENGRWSQNRLAAAVAMKPATLSQARLPKSNENHRPIAESKAKQIEALTGWPADAAHWPAGIRKD